MAPVEKEWRDHAGGQRKWTAREAADLNRAGRGETLVGTEFNDAGGDEVVVLAGDGN